jgi:hypothetical protein
MKPNALAPLILLAALLACGQTATVEGEIFTDRSCAARIGDQPWDGPDGGVRIASRAVDPEDPETRHILVVYCSLHQPEEEPVRIDFVKLRAPADGVLEPGEYTIDAGGDQPRTIGVVVTAPGALDPRLRWEPVSGTLTVTEASANAVEATFRVELRGQSDRGS